jgi:hypothetical protein
MLSIATHHGSRQLVKNVRFSTSSAADSRPIRKVVTLQERMAIRAARKNQLQQQPTATTTASLSQSRWVWYMAVLVPSGLLTWGIADAASPPRKLADNIGLTDMIASFTDTYAKPSFDKLLPDWQDVRTVFRNVASL